MDIFDYQSLVCQHDAACGAGLAEKKSTYRTLTERHMQAIWLEQKYFYPLDIGGSPIEILSPGIWNGEAGPDFLKAHISINGKEYRGDIELHLFHEGWYAHHHHHDPRYNDVILHIAFWEPANKKPIVTSNGNEVLQAFLEPKIKISQTRLLKLIDLDLYPYRQFAGSGRCSKLLFKGLSHEKTASLFHSAALWRLRDKWERLTAAPDAIEAGIAATLGYKHNADAFLALYHLMKQHQGGDERSLLAMALSAAGFFESHFQAKWGESAMYQNLRSMAPELKEGVKLRLDGIRPANHPVRRLAAMAKLLASKAADTLGRRLIVLWETFWRQGGDDNWKRFGKELTALIPAFEDPYWERHYTFESQPQKLPVALVGNDLIKVITANVLLPYLFSHINAKGNREELAAFSHFYTTLQAAHTTKGTYLETRFFGDIAFDASLRKADMQQGAFQIHRDFCIHYEASCQGCPFVDRYAAAVSKG